MRKDEFEKREIIINSLLQQIIMKEQNYEIRYLPG